MNPARCTSTSLWKVETFSHWRSANTKFSDDLELFCNKSVKPLHLIYVLSDVEQTGDFEPLETILYSLALSYSSETARPV